MFTGSQSYNHFNSNIIPLYTKDHKEGLRISHCWWIYMVCSMDSWITKVVNDANSYTTYQYQHIQMPITSIQFDLSSPPHMIILCVKIGIEMIVV